MATQRMTIATIYFCEWIDRWLMGNLLVGPRAVEGRRYNAACVSPEEAVAWAERCGDQFPEQKWLAARLRESARGWGIEGASCAIVVIREVFDASSPRDFLRQLLDKPFGAL